MGGAATSAALDTPTGVAVDASGNLFVADSHNNRIREVSGGKISTVAGSGPVGMAATYGGDGGSATAAELAKPTGVALDAAGNIYIADTNNNRLRKVGNGSISTVAGTGVQGYSGDGGAATAAELNTPQDVAVNASGDAVVADSQNERVRGVNVPTLTYASLAVGVTSPPQYVKIANSGSGTLTVQSLKVSAGFATASGGTCSALPISLTAGQSCTEAVVFEPTAPGVTQGSLVVSGSNVVPQTILLSGTASQSTPSITLTASASAVLLDNPVTLTAVVASANGTPSGTVSFLEGTVPIGSAPLNSGQASVSVSTPAKGPHSFTAIYGGGGAFTSATSSPVTMQVEDFNLNLASGSVTSVSVAPGGTATYQLVISPVGSTTFPEAIQLSASGLPAGATATVTLTILVPTNVAMLRTLEQHGRQEPLYFGLLLLPFADIQRSRPERDGEEVVTRDRPLRLRMLLMVMACTVLIFAGMTGCGSKSGFLGHSSQNYTITVTGTAGALSHSTTVKLNVK